jgi:integrase
MICFMAKRPNGTGSVYRRPGSRFWWVCYYRDGKPYYESAKSEFKADAENLLARRRGDIASGRFHGLASERVTIGELCQLVLDDYEYRKLRDYQILKWRFEKHIKRSIGELRATLFGQTEVKRYVKQRRASGASEATINRELSIVRRGFTLGIRETPPLVIRCPFIPKLEEDNVRQGFLRHAQYITLRNTLAEHLKCMFVVAYHIGNRAGELRKLQWSQVDLAGCEIRLPGRLTKSRKPRTAPIYGDMREWLVMQKEKRDQEYPLCPWVFHRVGKQISNKLTGWREACIEAKMPELLFHDLRRTAVRNMVRAGVPRTTAMAISGHRTEAIFRRYDIVDSNDLKLAAAKVENYLIQQQGVDISVNTKDPTLDGEYSKRIV